MIETTIAIQLSEKVLLGLSKKEKIHKAIFSLISKIVHRKQAN